MADGNELVLQNLDELIENALSRQLKDGLKLATQMIENEAKRKCPVDDGILRASITHGYDPEGLQSVVGTNVEYAPYVHEGTGIHAKAGRGRRSVPWRYKTPDGKWHTTKGQKPQPFLQEAVNETKEKLLSFFTLSEERRR